MQLLNERRKFKLDNSAILHMATINKRWSNIFRVSASLKEDICIKTLEVALINTIKRFPTIASKICRGVFGYYVEPITNIPPIIENQEILINMKIEDIEECGIRVLCKDKKVSIEIFHSLTDGYGGMIFLKSLIAEYLSIKYSIEIPFEGGILSCSEIPKNEEFEDSYYKTKSKKLKTYTPTNSYSILNKKEEDYKVNNTTVIVDVEEALKVAKQYNATLTEFISAAMIRSIILIQNREIPDIRKHKSVNVMIPINLRRIFKSYSLRNFTLYVIPEINPIYGRNSFEEVLACVKSKMKKEVSKAELESRIALNTLIENNLAIKYMPIAVKIMMLRIFSANLGEKKSCLSISNLGVINVPKVMEAYVDKFELVLGVRANTPYNCGITTYKGKLMINFTRKIKDSILEEEFAKSILELGLNSSIVIN